MFPLFWWGTCRWLAQDTGLCVDWSGLDTAMSQPTRYTTDWLGTRKYWKLVTVSRPGSHFLYSPLPRPHVRPQITGRVSLGFSWHQIRGFSTNHPVSNSQGADHCQLTSDTISVELVPMPQVEVPRLSWLQMQPCGLTLSCSDQETESWTFHDPNSMPKNSIEPSTKLRKPLTHCPHFKVEDKIRNSEMEEIFRAWEEWRWVGLPCPPEQNTLPSGPFALPSLFIDFYWSFTQ